MRENPYVVRTTWWEGTRGPEQVAVAMLDPDTWEPLAEAVERIGPFDRPDTARTVAAAAALNLARRQLAGQLEMEL